MSIVFNDCKDAIEFYIHFKNEVPLTRNIAEICGDLLFRGTTANNTNPESIVGFDDIVNAIVDLDKIFKSFKSVMILAAFKAYVEKDTAAAIRNIRMVTSNVGKSRLYKRDRFYSLIQDLAEKLICAGYLSKSYYAEREQIEELESENSLTA